MNIVKELSELEKKTLKVYEGIVVLQCHSHDKVPAQFHSKVVLEIKELQSMADKIEHKIHENYLERV